MRRHTVFSGMTYREREAYRESRKAEIAQEKARKAAKAMTCQCCARPIFAQTGTLAHHGYERPGYGWQTASCMGAKELPFEVDRTRLADLIRRLQEVLVATKKDLADIKSEVTPISLFIEVDCDPVVDTSSYTRRVRYNATTKEERTYTRAQWNALVGDFDGQYHYHSKQYRDITIDGVIHRFEMAESEEAQVREASRFGDYDKRKASAAAVVSAKIATLKADIAMSQKRYDTWKPTHSHFNKATKEWVAL